MWPVSTETNCPDPTLSWLSVAGRGEVRTWHLGRKAVTDKARRYHLKDTVGNRSPDFLLMLSVFSEENIKRNIKQLKIQMHTQPSCRHQLRPSAFQEINAAPGPPYPPCPHPPMEFGQQQREGKQESQRTEACHPGFKHQCWKSATFSATEAGRRVSTQPSHWGKYIKKQSCREVHWHL